MALKNIEDYRKLAQQMIDADKGRDEAFRAYDAMYHNEWELPDTIQELQWVRRVVSTDPHDAISAGVRVLSALEPRVTFHPLAPNRASKERANEVERNLLWQLKSSSARRASTIVRDVVHSALMYHVACALVIDIDHQIGQKEAVGANTNRLKAMRRQGRFMVNTYNPQNVHVRWSNVMAEAVLLVQVMTVQEVIDEFGSQAEALKEMASTEKEQPKVTLFDYWDYEVRCVWVEIDISPKGTRNVQTTPITIIAGTAHDLPFLPWAVRLGGSTLEANPKHKHHPLLYSVYTAGQWDTQNIAKSLYMSEVIALSGSPRFKEEGPNIAETEVDYGEPERKAKVPAGNQLGQLPPQPIDRAMAEIDDRLSGAVRQSTVSSVLQNADVPSGTAFATLNLVTQTAVGALKPYKELAEGTLSDILSLMLLWSHYTENDLHAYGVSKDDQGTQYSIKSDEIEPDAIYIDVELTPDVPTDRIQKINAASIAVQTLGMSKERALEEAGITDPGQEMQNSMFEQLVETMMQIEIEKMREAARFEMQMMMQQGMAAIQEAKGAQQSQEMMGPQGIPGAEGQGFNPAMGGQVPAEMMPGATREMQSGMDRQGNSMMGPEMME